MTRALFSIRFCRIFHTEVHENSQKTHWVWLLHSDSFVVLKCGLLCWSSSNQKPEELNEDDNGRFRLSTAPYLECNHRKYSSKKPTPLVLHFFCFSSGSAKVVGQRTTFERELWNLRCDPLFVFQHCASRTSVWKDGITFCCQNTAPTLHSTAKSWMATVIDSYGKRFDCCQGKKKKQTKTAADLQSIGYASTYTPVIFGLLMIW